MASLRILELRDPYNPTPDTVTFIVIVVPVFGLPYYVGPFSTQEDAEEFIRIFLEMEEREERIQELLRQKELQLNDKKQRELEELLKKLYEQLLEEIIRAFSEKQNPHLTPGP